MRIGSLSVESPHRGQGRESHAWVGHQKYREKVFFGKLQRQTGPILRDTCRQRSIELLEERAMAEHIHMVLSIPRKYSVVNTLGFLKARVRCEFIVSW
jgi:REP element-mobilizing transposase RayT